MKFGVTTSIGIHIAAVALGVVSLSSPRLPDVADVEALPIDIIPIESITKTIEGDKEADRAETPAPKPTKKTIVINNAENVGETKNDKKAEAPKETVEPPVEKAEAPEAVPEPTPKPEPTPVPTPELKVEPKPEEKVAILETKPDVVKPVPEETVEESFKAPERVTRPKKRPERPKPETAQTNKRKDVKKGEKKKKSDKIAALLNKQDSSAGGAKRSKKKAALGAKKGNNATKLSQSEVDALRGQIQACWNVGALAGSDDAETLRLKVEFKLKPDGTIDGKLKANASGGSKRSIRTFVGSATRAIRRCAPYELPKAKYEDWADVEVNFSLKDML